MSDGTYLGFVGVSTRGSSIRTVFPVWARALGLPTDELVGHDLPLDAARSVYRELIRRIRDDPRHRGALVTTHKVDVYRAAADLFDDLDESSDIFGEISSIYKRDGRLIGAARDPITVRRAVEEFLPSTWFATRGGQVACFGSGGSGLAFSSAMAVRDDRPELIHCTGLDTAQLDHARHVHAAAGLPAHLFRYVCVSDPTMSDAVLAALPPGSVVANATGLGKDRPGSPLTEAAEFPPDSVAWDFNYRGTLEFLAQARTQPADRRLRVEDGWRYFVHGWSQVIDDVFDVGIDHATVVRLGDLAASLR